MLSSRCINLARGLSLHCSDLHVFCGVKALLLLVLQLQEYLDASICLLQFQLGIFDSTKCNCKSNHPKLTKTANSLHAHRGYTEVAKLYPELVAPLVQTDLQLYDYALTLFKKRVAMAEQQLGTTFLCE